MVVLFTSLSEFGHSAQIAAMTLSRSPGMASLLSSKHPTPPRPLCALLRLYCSGVGLVAPTLLLESLRLHLLLPLFLPDLLQQLPSRISDCEHRAVNVIWNSLSFVPQLLSRLLALQQIVLD